MPAKLNGKSPTVLTDKQEEFVLGLLDGLSQRKAYKRAYGAGNMSDITIDNKASKLFRKDHVQARYNELHDYIRGKATDEAVKKGIMSEMEILKSIQYIAEKQKLKNPSASLKALEMLGKYYSLFTDKIEHTGEVKVPAITIKKGKKKDE